MRYLLSLLAVFLSITALAPAFAEEVSASGRDYQAGQIWTYKTREGDEGSLVKIGAIETIGDENIYHISVIDVHLDVDAEPTSIDHLPVSQETLDASLLEQVESAKEFPDQRAGIAYWHEARGGWFTIPIADIVQVVDESF